MISATTLATVLEMAGPVANTASFAFASGVAAQCGRYTSQTRTAPTSPPASCAAMYPGTSLQRKLPIAASPIVTAGLRWAPLIRPTAYTAVATATPHPTVITIQPPF
jgi:hypothetical protein